MSKMRLKPATIGVVRSCAMPQAVKQQMSATNNTTMPLPSSGSLRASSGRATPTPLAMLLNGSRSSRGRPTLLNSPVPTDDSALPATRGGIRRHDGALERRSAMARSDDQPIALLSGTIAAKGMSMGELEYRRSLRSAPQLHPERLRGLTGKRQQQQELESRGQDCDLG